MPSRFFGREVKGIANSSSVSRITLHRPSWVRANRGALASLLTIGLIYLGVLAAMPPQGLTQHDTGAKYLQVRNLRITSSGLDWSINYPARQLDPQLQFVPFSPKQYYADQGKIYLQWPIFLGLLTRVPWKLMGFWGLYVVPLLAGLGTMLAAYLLALAIGLARRVAWLAIPLTGLATPVAIYSLLFFEHTLAAMLVTLSLLSAALSLTNGRLSTRGAAWSAMWLAAAIYFRSELYVLAVVVALIYTGLAWKQRAWRPLLAWVGVFLLALVPLWAFYAITEGNILPLHATRYFAPGSDSGGLDLPALRYIVSAGWGVAPDFLFGPQSFPLSPVFSWWLEAAGLLGVILCGVAALARLLRPTTSRAARLALLVVGLALIVPISAATLFSARPYYNLHGFLLASPFVALALWPPRQVGEDGGLSRAGLLYIAALLYTGFHTLVISALSGLGPISLHEWGQRYILPAYPALVVTALLAGWRLWSAYGRSAKWRTQARAGVALALLLALAGVGFNVRGYIMLYDERQQVVAWLDLAQKLPDRVPLVTNVWWLPLNLAAGFYSRPIMLAQDEARMAQWARAMRDKGLSDFGVMTDDPSLFNASWRGQWPGIVPAGPAQQARGMWLQEFKTPGR